MKIKLLLGLAILSFGLVGCSSQDAKGPGGESTLDKVLEQQTSQTEEANSQTEESKSPQLSDIPMVTKEPGGSEEGIDYDLTTMGSDMVYATVFQMMSDSDSYIGKTIRMEGTYYASYYESTGLYYHYVIIQDAQACCSQGIEFVWGDGSHVYPDEYPAEETEVIVTGIFETYREEGDENLYCHLTNAKLELASK